MVRRVSGIALTSLTALGLLACGGDGESTGTGGTGSEGVSLGMDGSTGGGTQPSEGGLGAGLDPGGGTPPGGLQPAVLEETLPTGFTASMSAAMDAWDYTGPPAGGYQLVGPIDGFAEDATNACANVLRGIVRDFDHAHQDFGAPKGESKDLVSVTLGENRKPIATGAAPGVAGALEEWYENGAGGNVPYVVDFWLEPQGDTFVFDSSRFFPVEGVASTSGNDNDNQARNFGFTTEIHTRFEYKGGEVFNFRGDDDVFVYINGVLAVNLGGIHSALEATVNLDTFAAANGLMVGQVYTLDLFHAERNPTGSNFRIETTLDFRECAILEDDLVVR